MHNAWLARLLSLLLIAAGCGGGEESIDVGPGTGGSSGDDDDRGGAGSPPVRRDSGAPGGSDSGTAGTGGPNDAGTDAGVVDPAAPRVEIVAPEAASDPNAGELVMSATVTVRCRVTRSTDAAARDVDESSIAIRLTRPDEPTRPPIDGVVTAMPDGEFTAEFRVDDLPNGRLRLECSAADVSMPARVGTAAVDTFLDLGPTVSILEPGDGSAHARRSPVLIRFRVSPAPVSDDDERADVTEVLLSVIGREFVAAEDPDEPGLYSISIDFNDQTLFAMPPTAAEIVVTAANGRSPTAARRSAEIDIVIDAAGPQIAVTSPPNFDIVNGQVTLVVSIVDPSGVQADSVVGRIDNQFVLDSWSVDGSTYVEQFNTRDPLFEDWTELTINITAKDTVGNSATASHTLRLDNVPPIVSLDPPPIREWVVGEMPGTRTCSAPFDPVGSDAVSDLDYVAAASLYRILVFERTNGIAGQLVSYVAGVNEGSVKLYAQGDPSIPLLIDTNGDGVCDEINDSEEWPQSQRPVLKDDFSPLDVRGPSYFSSTTTFIEPEHVASGYNCVNGQDMEAPGTLCPATAMYRVIHQPITGAPRAIYGIAPSNGPTGACEGNSWLLLTSVGEGWACLAARAEDRIENVGVSRPIRVCVDDGVGAPPTCSNPGSDPPPTCVDDCLPPDDVPANYMLFRQ